MTTKKAFYKSKEIWVLFIAILLIITKYLGLDLPGILNEASDLYVKISPVIALVLRLFITNSKLILIKKK